MKKKLFFLFALTMLVANVARAQEIKEDLIYAVVEGSTATYYYDNKYEERENVLMPYWDMEDEALERLTFADNTTKVVFDPSMDKASLTSTAGWFSGLALLEEIDGLQYLHTEEVTSMVAMFSGCKSLTSLDLSTFNTEKVTFMGAMFGRCQSLTSLNLSTFNTANVTNMSTMFSGCQSLTSLDLSTFNSANVTNMAGMFMQCTALKNIDLTGFNTENVTNMEQMFALCEALTTLDLRSFNIDKVEEMSYMFYECKELTTIYCNDNWGAYGIPGDEMFAGCKKLVGGNGTTFNYTTGIDYAHPDGGKDAPGYFTATPQVYTALEKDGFLYYYFDDQRTLKEGLTAVYDADDSNWLNLYSSNKVHYAVIDESMKNAEMTSMNYLFAGLNNLYEIYDLQNLNTAGVTSMHGMFADCQYLDNLDLTTFNTDNVTDMAEMFSGCKFLASLDLTPFNTENVTDMDSMFYQCNALENINLSNFNTENVTDMASMFYQCNALENINLSNFNTTNLTNMNAMFAECEALKVLDLSSFNTANVNNMFATFLQCSALESIDLSNFNTDNVTEMSGMFAYCSALKNINISHFNTANVKTMSMMFSECENLTTIYAKGYWDKNEVVEDSEDMFYGCKKLVGENGTAYDESKTDITYARPDGGTDAPGYFTTPTYTVTFLDWDATLLFKETVKEGQDAKGPEKDPTREGYTFTGWSKPVTNITSDLTVIAQYKDKNATALYETGIQTTDDCRKFIEKGILYIERNGIRYTIQGSIYTIQDQHLN